MLVSTGLSSQHFRYWLRGRVLFSQLARTVSKTISFYAFDLSKESIQLAAKSDHEWKVKWFVGDLARLPLLDQSMDLLLDIFSPANYQEFKRVLAPDGRLIKVIPTPSHLQEIRQKVRSTSIRPIIPMSRLFDISLIILRLNKASIARKLSNSHQHCGRLF